MSRLQGPSMGFAGPTSETWTTPYPHAVGTKARDKDGNEYLFCSAVTAVAGNGILVSITADHQIAPLLGTSLLAARVGIAMQTLAVGAAGWVQIYGVAFVQGNAASANLAGATTNATSLSVANTSVTDGDAFGLFPRPQFVVTSPTGTIAFQVGTEDALGGSDSLVSLSSNVFGAMVNYIYGMYLMTAAQVSALPDRLITERWPNVTSPVSAVSDTSGPVTLTTLATSHIGGEYVVYLNYPYVSGVRTS